MTDYKNALRFVNKLRRMWMASELEELPKGELNSCYRCPIANALRKDLPLDKVEVSQGVVCVEDSLRTLWYGRPPLSVIKFITKFDKGKYPELVSND